MFISVSKDECLTGEQEIIGEADNEREKLVIHECKAVIHLSNSINPFFPPMIFFTTYFKFPFFFAVLFFSLILFFGCDTGMVA